MAYQVAAPDGAALLEEVLHVSVRALGGIAYVVSRHHEKVTVHDTAGPACSVGGLPHRLHGRAAEAVVRYILVAHGPCATGRRSLLLVSHLDSRRAIQELADWRRRLDAIVNMKGFEDDGHLHEYFEAEERERLIQELERMPKGSRSLRRAIEIVCPELVNGAA